MKAITIWQPWASLIACGTKKYETRSWPTKYRGPIAIHAAAKEPRTLPQEVREALDQLDEVPLGAIIATAELVNVWHIVYNPGTDVDVAKNIPIGAESLTTDKHAPDVRHMRKSKEVRRLFRESIRPYGNERAGKLEKMGLQNV
jgi:hypothetical protein